jgi:5-methylcytosine-specific restriction endonuclease McrA
MRDFSLTHLSGAVLIRDLAALITHDRVTTAAILAHIAEVDARRLYAPAGYPSMHAYCVGELRLSEDAASKRIQAARAARQFPALLDALADGRLHLTAVCLLAPHLTVENVEGLMVAATHRRKAEIEELLARLFPRLELPAMVGAPAMVGSIPAVIPEHAPAHVGDVLHQHAPGHVEDVRPDCKAAPESFLLNLTIGKSTRDKLRYAQDLLSHAVPSGDVAQVLDRALDALIVELEKRKLGAGTRLRPKLGPATPSVRRLHTPPVGERSVVTSMVARSRPTTRNRYVPARVRRAVWERDGGQCTFVGASGHRCESRRFLEFDHVDPVARGGRASVEGMRLRCRAHNQYEAERIFGAGFMSEKRHEARGAAAEARARVAHNMPRGMLEGTDARERAALDKECAAREQVRDVLAGLQNLGCRADQARRAAAIAANLHGATLEERMRAALTSLGRR